VPSADPTVSPESSLQFGFCPSECPGTPGVAMRPCGLPVHCRVRGAI
jgi:hypothetical protein